MRLFSILGLAFLFSFISTNGQDSRIIKGYAYFQPVLSGIDISGEDVVGISTPKNEKGNTPQPFKRNGNYFIYLETKKSFCKKKVKGIIVENRYMNINVVKEQTLPIFLSEDITGKGINPNVLVDESKNKVLRINISGAKNNNISFSEIEKQFPQKPVVIIEYKRKGNIEWYPIYEISDLPSIPMR